MSEPIHPLDAILRAAKTAPEAELPVIERVLRERLQVAQEQVEALEAELRAREG